MAAGAARLIGPVSASAILHGGVAATLVFLSARHPPSMPPIYSVEIIAAAPSPTPAIGVVAPSVQPVPAPAPRAPDMTVPAPPELAVKSIQKTKAVPRATPTPPTAKAKAAPATAVARGGPTGGAGADVANVRIDGIEFPYPGYLNNIVRQVALNFSPNNPAPNAHAEIAFLIRRDGTVVGLRFVTRSNDYGFDLEAQGALEKASPAFGPLPDGFHDDVLPVVFSFDPRLSH
jgi:protein TonB